MDVADHAALPLFGTGWPLDRGDERLWLHATEIGDGGIFAL